jgi:centromeric protein E
MATTALPRPSLPPTAPLPSIPVPKTRKSSLSSNPSTPSPANTGLPLPSRSPSGLSPLSPRPALVPHHVATSSLPKLPTLGPSPAPHQSNRHLRKTISIGSFPQPPRPGPRTSSQASSPVSTCTSPNSPAPTSSLPKTPNTSRRAVSQGTLIKRPPRTSSRVNQVRSFTGATSLLDGANGKSVSLLSLPSPPSSRATSAQGSYETGEEDMEERMRGRVRSMDDVRSEADRQGKDTKGNVLVSVRVRPDVPSNEASKSELEWMVDGRRSLISYRGKEGGEYVYGKLVM